MRYYFNEVVVVQAVLVMGKVSMIMWYYVVAPAVMHLSSDRVLVWNLVGRGVCIVVNFCCRYLGL